MSTTTNDSPPDLASVDLACPLCGYNLRGLTEPRCPECGFAFTWAELLDAKRDRHAWLFEHAIRGRRRRAFVATYFRTCLPRRFWREVTPANPVRRKPLIRYWVINALLLLSGVIIGPLVVEAARVVVQYQTARTMPPPFPRPPRTPSSAGRLAPVPLSWPPPRPTPPPIYSPTFALRVADAYLRRTGGAFVAVIVVTAAWPWLTVAALLVFQTSMRRAKTNADHLLRAATYSCDFGLLITGLAVVVFWLMRDRGAPIRRQQVVELSAGLAVLTAAVCAVVTTYRSTIACGRYLRFHLPLATVLASQVIAFLVLLAVAMRVEQAW